MNPIQQLHDTGQSIWLDNITRGLLNSGTLGDYLDRFSPTGLTSNPSICDHAINNSTLQDAYIQRQFKAGKNGNDCSSGFPSQMPQELPILSRRSYSHRTRRTWAPKDARVRGRDPHAGQQRRYAPAGTWMSTYACAASPCRS
jgi:hypothetical protein